MKEEHFYYNNWADPTRQYSRNTQGAFLLVLKWLFKMLVFSPLVVTGYFITTGILDKKAHGLLWFGLPLLFAYLMYAGVMAIKQVMLDMRAKNNGWWRPLYTVCVAFTCILPAYLVFAPLNYIVHEMKGSETITWIVVFVFTAYVYFKYDFLQHKRVN
jgi:hypothetical protein